LFYTEYEGEKLSYGYALDEVLFASQSKYQKIEIIKTKAYGRMMIIDGFVMLTDDDEFVYHEMISHVPLCMHNNPKNILIVGGGDGGTVREVAKHKSVEKIVLCEIDGMVVDVARQFFPRVASALDDPRVEIKIGDGISFVAEQQDEFDVIIIDSTDPVGPGEGLFSKDFYRSVSKALKPNGLMVAQSESPWADREFLQKILNNISAGFKHVAPYIAPIPTYPRGLWSWTMAGQSALDHKQYSEDRFEEISEGLNYLTQDTYAGCFALPPFYRKKLFN
jgi:spermidine synthase